MIGIITHEGVPQVADVEVKNRHTGIQYFMTLSTGRTIEVKPTDRRDGLFRVYEETHATETV